MVFDQGRVAEIWVPASGNRGTGYWLFPGCILTAYHVVKGHDGKTIKFRLLRDYQENSTHWCDAELIFGTENSPFDLALLKSDGPENCTDEPPIIKTLDLRDAIQYEACGFPLFMKQTRDGTPITTPYRARGAIQPSQFDSIKTPGELLLEVQNPPPTTMEGWKGMSGALAFTEDGYLVGVVIQGPKASVRVLQAIALEHVLGTLPAFNAAMQEYFQQQLSCVDVDRVKAREIYRKLQEQRVRRTRTIAAHLDEDLFSLNEMAANYDVDISALPEKRLEALLVTIGEWNREILIKAWHCSPASRTFNVNLGAFFEISALYGLVTLSNHADSKQRFFSELDRQLIQLNQPDYSGQLRELTEAAFQLDISKLVDAGPNLGTTADSAQASGQSSLLIKVKIAKRSGSSLRLSVVSWIVRNNQAYQARFEHLVAGVYSGKDSPTRLGTPKELLNPLGRSLVMVLSDCISPLWRSGVIHGWLADWAKHGPAVIVQWFPERYWSRTGLHAGEEIWLSALSPGMPSDRLVRHAVTSDYDDWLEDDDDDEELCTKMVAVPVVTLEPDSLAEWARGVAGCGDAQVRGRQFELTWDKRQWRGPVREVKPLPESGEQRFWSFAENASSMAKDLAGLMSDIDKK